MAERRDASEGNRRITAPQMEAQGNCLASVRNLKQVFRQEGAESAIVARNSRYDSIKRH